ncbi:MAG: FlgD immunoglobulin-like domain containing protein, partial [bacterium]
LVKSQCSGLSNTGVDIWMAQGTPSGDGAVTATLAITPSNAVIAVSRYSGVAAVNPVGNIVSGNSNGVNGACASGVENNLYSFSLTTTVNGAMAYGAAAMRSRSHTPGAGYAERAEFKQGSGGGIASIAVQDKNVVSAATVTVDGSFSGNVDWAVVGLEIKPQALSKRGEIAGNDELAAPPLVYQLEQNYPNPFNPSTMIKFALPAAGKVIVKIYSETGQLVRTLVDGEMAAGRHGIHWNGKNQAGRSIASGVYLYQIVARGQNGEITFSQTKRMTLLK